MSIREEAIALYSRRRGLPQIAAVDLNTNPATLQPLSLCAMASSVSQKSDDIPVIWLLAPEILTPSPDPIHPIPITISTTLATLIFFALVILYNKKPKAISSGYTDIELENLKASIRVIRPASAAAPPGAIPPTPQVARTSPPRPMRSPPQPQIESGSNTISELRVNTCHGALKDICDAPHNSSTRRPSLTSAAGSNYLSPNSMTVAREFNESDDQQASKIIRPASSDYSVSIGPTPLPSRRGSVRNREANGLWTRLRLGSEYDGDRTFVPSEAYL